MLQGMTDKVKGWFTGVIIALIAISFVLFGVSRYFQSASQQGPVVVKVGGAKIHQSAVQNQMNKMQGMPQYADMDTAALKQIVLNQMISERIAQQTSTQLGLVATDDQINAQIRGTSMFMQNGTFSMDRFKAVLQNNGISVPVYQAMVHGQMVQNQLASLFLQFIIPDEELHEVAKINNQTRDIAYIDLKTSQFMSTAVPTNQQIQKYYEQHKSAFMQSERVKLHYILISPDSLKKNIHVSADETKQYYNSNMRAYKTPAKWQVVQVSLPITGSVGDKSYADAQKKLQQFKFSGSGVTDFSKQAKAAGLTASVASWVSVANGSPNELALLRNMKANQVSRPFAMGNVLKILYVAASQPSKQKSFAEVEGVIKKSLLAQKLGDKVTQVGGQLSDLVYTNPDNLQAAATSLKVAIQTSPWLTQSGAVDKKALALFANPKLLKVAFSNDVLQNKNNSNVVNLANGALLVLRIAVYQPKVQLSLAQAKNTIIADIKLADAKQAMQKFTTAVQSNVATGNMSLGLLKSKSLTWQAVTSLTIDDKRVSTALSVRAFLMRPHVAPGKSVVLLPMATGDSVIMVLNAIHESSQKPTAAKLAGLNNALVQQNGSNLLALYYRHRRMITKIKLGG